MKPADYWYPWNPERFRRDTRGLGLRARGAYRELIDEYMSSGRPIPNDERKIAAIVGCSVETWREISPEVMPYFQAVDAVGVPVDNPVNNPLAIQLTNKRCESVLFSQLSAAEMRAERSRKGGLARQRKAREAKDKQLELSPKLPAQPQPKAEPISAQISQRREDKFLTTVEVVSTIPRTREGNDTANQQQQQESIEIVGDLSEEDEDNPFVDPSETSPITSPTAENQAVQANTPTPAPAPEAPVDGLTHELLAADVAEILRLELDDAGIRVCERWVAKGFDVELDILPTLRDRAAAGYTGAAVSTLKQFTKQIQTACYRRQGQHEKAKAAGAEGDTLERSRKRWGAILALWESTGKWKDSGPDPNSLHCLAPPDLLRELRARLAQSDDDEKRRPRPAP